MFTSRTSIGCPGTFEPNRSVMPSSGCTRITSAFWAQLLGVVARTAGAAPLEHHRDLGDPAPEPLAGAQVERHAGPAPGVDVEA
jgi:hypothetical protein